MDLEFKINEKTIVIVYELMIYHRVCIMQLTYFKIKNIYNTPDPNKNHESATK